MTQTIAQKPPTDTTTAFLAWCDFITDGLDQMPDNGDSKQVLTDDEE